MSTMLMAMNSGDIQRKGRHSGRKGEQRRVSCSWLAYCVLGATIVGDGHCGQYLPSGIVHVGGNGG